MIGAIVGDIVGSRFELNNYKGKDFTLFTSECHPTDDSYMTLAVASALLEALPDKQQYLTAKSKELLADYTIASMQHIGREHLNCGFGESFKLWLQEMRPKPYGSWGNGAAMRVSPCGWAGQSLSQVQELSAIVTAVSHNHPEALKGAEAVAVAIYLSRTGVNKSKLKAYLEEHYYDLSFSLDEIRESYSFESSCEHSVPQAIVAFLEGENFEDTLRNAISLGGDSDTIGAISGSIAEAYYGIPQKLKMQALSYLTTSELSIVQHFTARWG